MVHCRVLFLIMNVSSISQHFVEIACSIAGKRLVIQLMQLKQDGEQVDAILHVNRFLLFQHHLVMQYQQIRYLEQVLLFLKLHVLDQIFL